MKYVVKLGGASLEQPELLHAIGKAIAELSADGHRVAVVHGGGVQLTRTLAQMGPPDHLLFLTLCGFHTDKHVQR